MGVVIPRSAFDDEPAKGVLGDSQQSAKKVHSVANTHNQRASETLQRIVSAESEIRALSGEEGEWKHTVKQFGDSSRQALQGLRDPLAQVATLGQLGKTTKFHEDRLAVQVTRKEQAGLANVGYERLHGLAEDAETAGSMAGSVQSPVALQTFLAHLQSILSAVEETVVAVSVPLGDEEQTSAMLVDARAMTVMRFLLGLAGSAPSHAEKLLPQLENILSLEQVLAVQQAVEQGKENLAVQSLLACLGDDGETDYRGAFAALPSLAQELGLKAVEKGRVTKRLSHLRDADKRKKRQDEMALRSTELEQFRQYLTKEEIDKASQLLFGARALSSEEKKRLHAVLGQVDCEMKPDCYVTFVSSLVDQMIDGKKRESSKTGKGCFDVEMSFWPEKGVPLHDVIPLHRLLAKEDANSIMRRRVFAVGTRQLFSALRSETNEIKAEVFQSWMSLLEWNEKHITSPSDRYSATRMIQSVRELSALYAETDKHSDKTVNI